MSKPTGNTLAAIDARLGRAAWSNMRLLSDCVENVRDLGVAYYRDLLFGHRFAGLPEDYVLRLAAVEMWDAETDAGF
jgi:hypothetical protein